MIDIGSYDPPIPEMQTCLNYLTSLYIPPAPINTHFLTKQIILKYIHTYLDSFPDISSRDIPDATQMQGGSNFIQKDHHKLFSCWKFRNCFNIIVATKNRKLTIGGYPPHTLGGVC